jgi:acylphosphatase
MSDAKAIRHVVIHGRVQRVGYRAWVADMASAHRLEGWVRNRRDGTVEAVFAGPEPAVKTMIEACRRGPSKAHVETIEQRNGGPDDLTPRRRGDAFSVLSTA